MLDVLGPGEIRDVNQAVHAFLDLEKRAEIGELAHSPLDYRADAVALRHGGPRVGFELLDAQRNAPLARLHFEHHGLHLIAGLDHLARMLHAPAPGHLGDVDKALDAGFDFDERAVIGDAHDASNHAAARRAAPRQGFPWVRAHLAQTQRDPLLALIEFEHADGDFVAGVNHLGRMIDAAVRHVAHVQQPVDAAQIDERAVIGEVFDDAGDHRAFKQMLERGHLARL